MAHDKCRKVNVGTMLNDADVSSAVARTTAAAGYVGSTSRSDHHLSVSSCESELTHMTHQELLMRSSVESSEAGSPLLSQQQRRSFVPLAENQLTRSYSNSSQLSPYTKTYSTQRAVNCQNIDRRNSSNPIITATSSQLLPYSSLKDVSLSLHYLPKTSNAIEVERDSSLPRPRSLHMEHEMNKNFSNSHRLGLFHDSNFLHPDHITIISLRHGTCMKGRNSEESRSCEEFSTINEGSQSDDLTVKCNRRFGTALGPNSTVNHCPASNNRTCSLIGADARPTRLLPKAGSDNTLSVPSNLRKVRIKMPKKLLTILYVFRDLIFIYIWTLDIYIFIKS